MLKKKLSIIISITVVILLFSFALACNGSFANSRKIDVVYEFGGSAKEVSITYSNKNGDTEQRNGIKNNQSIQFQDVPINTFLYISSQNQTDSGTIVVSILVNGKEWKSSESSGAYAIATASGIYR